MKLNVDAELSFINKQTLVGCQYSEWAATTDAWRTRNIMVTVVTLCMVTYRRLYYTPVANSRLHSRYCCWLLRNHAGQQNSIFSLLPVNMMRDAVCVCVCALNLMNVMRCKMNVPRVSCATMQVFARFSILLRNYFVCVTVIRSVGKTFVVEEQCLRCASHKFCRQLDAASRRPETCRVSLDNGNALGAKSICRRFMYGNHLAWTRRCSGASTCTVQYSSVRHSVC